jgi:penicillin-binding protein 1A
MWHRFSYFYLKAERRYGPRLRRAWSAAKALLQERPALRYALIGYAGLIAICGIVVSVYFSPAVAQAWTADLKAAARMEETTSIFDRNGKLLYALYEKNRTRVPLSRISRHLPRALAAIEDRNFYQHSGFDALAIARSAWNNLLAARIQQGGSTLTQQLAKNTFLTSDKSYWRKIQEICLAARLESNFTKDQIMELYLNRVYFGAGLYGVEAASQGYFGKPASDLSLSEAATLAGLTKAPVLYSPFTNPSLAVKRRNKVLDAMVECGYISADQAESARQEVLTVKPHDQASENADYAVDYVREELKELFGNERIFCGGLRVYTTIDASMQALAEQSVENYLSALEKHRRLDASSRDDYLAMLQRQASVPAAGEAEAPRYLQGALVSMDSHSGEVYAIVGGRNYRESKFNRAVHARRQTGSAFKPFVYVAALTAGMTPSTMLTDDPVKIPTGDGYYVPSNSGRRYGSLTLRVALRNSVNTVAVQLGQLVGVSRVIRTAHDFGIEEELPNVASLPLGAGEVTLLEMVRAYSVFPNAGKLVSSHVIRKVEDRDGVVIYEHQPLTRYVIDPQTAFLMTTMLSDAVDHGTGQGVRTAGFRLPAGGKTGTTDDYHDAWFIGFTPDVVTGVWVGFDVPRKIMAGGYGATLAIPIWVNYMKNTSARFRRADFAVPDGIVKATVCSRSGLLASGFCPYPYSDYFTADNAPKFPCAEHSVPVVESESLQKADSVLSTISDGQSEPPSPLVPHTPRR